MFAWTNGRISRFHAETLRNGWWSRLHFFARNFRMSRDRIRFWCCPHPHKTHTHVTLTPGGRRSNAIHPSEKGSFSATTSNAMGPNFNRRRGIPFRPLPAIVLPPGRDWGCPPPRSPTPPEQPLDLLQACTCKNFPDPLKRKHTPHGAGIERCEEECAASHFG